MAKLLKDTKFFSEVDLKKNKNIDFNKLAYRSGIKIWWLCKNKHSYRATPHHKTRGRKCPYCTIGTKKVSIEKSILKIKPELAKLWHPKKNGRNQGESGLVRTSPDFSGGSTETGFGRGGAIPTSCRAPFARLM